MTVLLIRGDDGVLIGDAVRQAVAEAVGAEDSSLVVDELDEDRLRGDDSFRIAPLVDAAQTPPFLTSKRVVVGRHLGRFTRADDIAPLVAYLSSPLPTTDLVLVWERGVNPKQDRLGAPPKSLLAAVAEAGGSVIEVDVPTQAAAAGKWLDERLDDSALAFSGAARRAVGESLGEDRSRVLALLEVLQSTYGPGARLEIDDVEPFLGERGSVPPWELTDAIAEGDRVRALDALHRMMGAGDRHPLQIMATLHSQYARVLRLDGAGARDDKAAAALLGMKGSTFPAKKVLTLSRKMGTQNVAQAMRLLAQADLDLRGDEGLARHLGARSPDRPAGQSPPPLNGAGRGRAAESSGSRCRPWPDAS